MKLSLMRPALVLALALGLASCGGKATFPIAGVVNGLQYDGMVLSTNGMTLSVKAPATPSTTPVAFQFPNELDYGDVYAVKIDHQPDHQTCEIRLPSGNNTAGRVQPINVIIDCGPRFNTVGGKVSDLTATGLVLANGSTTLAVAANASTFVFPAIPYNQTYGITVLTQPTGQTCTVVDGTGTMRDDPVTNIQVNCK